MRRKYSHFVLSLSLLILSGCLGLQEHDPLETSFGVQEPDLEEGLEGLDECVVSIDAESLRIIIKDAWENADVRDFKDLQAFIVLDVRGFDAYMRGRIRGAVNVELKDLRHESDRWERDRKIIVYSSDRMCRVAPKAARRLIAYGFKKVFIYRGGIEEWLREGFEVDGC